MRHPPFPRQTAFTLVELLIVVALIAIVLTLAAPSFRNMIEMQRLRSIAAQVVTDVQFARSEAATRQKKVFITFGSSTELAEPTIPPKPAVSCYVLHTCANDTGCTCTCTDAASTQCPNASNVKIRAVQVPTSLSVRVALTPAGAALPSYLAFDPATGGMLTLTSDPTRGVIDLEDPAWIDTSLTRTNPPTLRTIVALSGRPSVCAPATVIFGVPSC